LLPAKADVVVIEGGVIGSSALKAGDLHSLIAKPVALDALIS
jgi:hypothetical protein